MLALAQGAWVAAHQNVLVTGATGCGTSFLACALAQAACRLGHVVLCQRTPGLFDDLAIGRADGRYARLLGSLARVQFLVLDDFLLTPAPVDAWRDLLDAIEDRAGLPPRSWPARKINIVATERLARRPAHDTD